MTYYFEGAIVVKKVAMDHLTVLCEFSRRLFSKWMQDFDTIEDFLVADSKSKGDGTVFFTSGMKMSGQFAKAYLTF